MDWHPRYRVQAAWTRDLRDYLFRAAGLASASRLLEVGCGTGAILEDLHSPAFVHALDIDRRSLLECRHRVPAAVLVHADALSLPYSSGAFDIVYCHFLLLWLKDPVRALKEMKRVTRPGGSVLAIAEPDYDSRIDEPDSLKPLGRWQAESLRQQGADPGFGARLSKAFHQANLELVEAGTLRSMKNQALSLAERESEWQVLESDLAGTVPEDQLSKMKALEGAAWERGERRLFVPTHFAWAKVI